MDGDEIAQGLRHLLSLHLEEAVMQPIVRHDRRVKGRPRLRDLVLMMGKHGIDAAAMNIEGLAEMLPRHGRALDVPAWATRRRYAGGRRPRGLARLRRLPQYEIHGIALVRGNLDARATDHLVARPARQLSLVGP